MNLSQADKETIETYLQELLQEGEKTIQFDGKTYQLAYPENVGDILELTNRAPMHEVNRLLKEARAYLNGSPIENTPPKRKIPLISHPKDIPPTLFALLAFLLGYLAAAVSLPFKKSPSTPNLPCNSQKDSPS